MLALADKMEEVVRHYQGCRKAQHPQRVPSPTGPLPDLPQEAEAKRSLEWLGREAHRLAANVAEKVSAGEPEWDGTGSPSASAGRAVERENAISRATGRVHAADGQLHGRMLWEAALRCRCHDDEHCISGCRRGRGKCPFGLQADDADSQAEAVHSTNEMI